MKILHYSLGMPPYRTGGLTKYATDLMLTQKKEGDEVLLFYPAEYNLFNNCTEIKYEYSYFGIRVHKMINPLPVPLLGGVGEPFEFIKEVRNNNFKEFINTENPDVIHIHTLMGLPKEFITIVKKNEIRLVFTTHDYYGLCPRVNMLNHNNQICDNYSNGKGCVDCNYGKSYSLNQIKVMQSKSYRKLKDAKLVKLLRQMKKKQEKSSFKKVKKKSLDKTIKKVGELDYSTSSNYQKLREYYLSSLSMVDVVHYNSSIAKEMYDRFLNKHGSLINITHGDIRDNRRLIELNANKVQLAYLGPCSEYKGFYDLYNMLKSLAKNGVTNWHLHIHGDNKASDIFDVDENYFSFHGKYNFDELSAILSHVNLLIIPSKWKETYGFIGLEALSYGVPVILSDNVGLKDVIQNGINGIVCNNSDLEGKLKLLLNEPHVLREMNENIVNGDFDEFLINSHSEEIRKIYQVN